MLLHSTLVAMFALPALINARGQFPVANGIIGGVPLAGSSDHLKGLAEAVPGDASTRTPRKLRVVENSGVCGGVVLVPYASFVI